MPHRRFYVRVELQLHALTCPGVWLCSHGSLEVSIKSLGYFFRTAAMEPRFPLLCHDEFIMEGYFNSVGTLEQMQQLLASEQLEITLWQNGRRLAYFVGRLGDALQPPTAPRFSCAHNTNVQLLMRATPAFPGILAPKVELSAHVITQHDRQRRPDSLLTQIQMDAERPRHRHAESRCLSHPEQQRRHQQAVCHAKQSNCSLSISDKSSSKQLRRLSTSSSSSLLSSNSQMLTPSSISCSCSHETMPSDTADEHQRSCDICQAYRRAFPSRRNNNIE